MHNLSIKMKLATLKYKSQDLIEVNIYSIFSSFQTEKKANSCISFDKQ